MTGNWRADLGSALRVACAARKVRAAALRRARPWGLLVLLPLGACAPHVPYPEGLQSIDPRVRVMAIKMAGDRRDRAAMPALVHRLEDEDPGVRFYAILALEKITGTRLGYDYAQPEAERNRAVKRWRNYVRTAGPPTSQPASGPATEPTSGP